MSGAAGISPHEPVHCGTLASHAMNILGINAYHGNASAAIVCGGRLVAAVEEERFNRVKYAAGFPAQDHSILLEGSRFDSRGNRPCVCATKSIRTAGDQDSLRIAHALLCSRARQGAREISGHS